MFCDRSKGKCREERQCRENIYDKYEYQCKYHIIRSECADCLIYPAFCKDTASDCQLNDNCWKTSEIHGQSCRNVPEYGIVSEPFKSGAIIGGGGAIFVQDLCQPVESRVCNTCQSSRRCNGQRGEAKNQERMHDQTDGNQLHFLSFDLLS